MPLISVYLRKGASPEFRRSLAGAIKTAFIGVLKLPDDDYNQVTFELDPENMIYDPNFFGEARSEKMILISMSFNHRSAELKAQLFEAVAKNVVEAVGIRIQDVMMNIVETARENWWAYGRTVNRDSGFDSRMVDAPT